MHLEPSRKPDDHFLVPAICCQILPSRVPRTCQDGASSLGLLARVGGFTAAEALLTLPHAVFQAPEVGLRAPPSAEEAVVAMTSSFSLPSSAKLAGIPQKMWPTLGPLFLFF